MKRFAGDSRRGILLGGNEGPQVAFDSDAPSVSTAGCRFGGCGEKGSDSLHRTVLVVITCLSYHVVFFLACDEYWRRFDESFPACTFFFFFKAEIISHTSVPLF